MAVKIEDLALSEEDKQAISDVGNEAFAVLRKLPAPWMAAAALAGVIAMLAEGGAENQQEDVISEKIHSLADDAVLVWLDRRKEEMSNPATEALLQ